MGGFALALGGAGEAAQKYSQQMRSILESRRQDFANLMQQAATTESDPDTRTAMLQHAMDAASGKPMGKIMSDVSGTLQKRVKDEQSLQKGVQGIQSAIGQPPATPAPPPPGATPVGQSAGTGGNALPNVAQPATSPIAQPANGGQIQVPPPISGAPNSPPNIEPVADVNLENPPPPPLGVGGGGISAPAPSLPPVAATPAPSLAPIIKDPQDIMNKYMRDPRWSAPANRPVMQAAMNDELTHNEALRQQADLVENRIRLMSDPRIQGLQQQLKQQGYSEYQIPSIIGSIIGAPVPMMPGIGSALYSPERLTNLKAGDIRKQYPGMFDTMLAGISDNSPVTLDINKVTREPMDVHVGAETTRTLFNDAGDATLVGSRSGVSGAPLTGLHSAGQVGPVSTGVNSQGHQVYEPRYSLISPGDLLTIGAGVNPGFVPSTSVSTQPGAPPVSTTRSKGSGRAVPPVGGAIAPPAISGGGIPPVGGGTDPAAFNDPLAKANYDNYVNGGLAPTGRQLQGVQAYAASHGLPMPGVTGATGQKSLATIDPVIQEVNDALTKLGKVKDDKNLALDYIKYKNGFSTPYDDLFTNLSFESLRSAASALQGMNSRAYPIISRALQHTPNLDRLGGLNPDSIPLMRDKLNSIKGILQQARDAATKDEAKSGVVPQVGSGQGGMVPPVAGPIQNWGRDAQGNPVPLP